MLPNGNNGHSRLYVGIILRIVPLVTPTQRQSIDEQMIPFKGSRNRIHQYLPNKPKRWGFKQQNYIIYFDNWFNFPELQLKLKQCGFHSVGTLRADCEMVERWGNKAKKHVKVPCPAYRLNTMLTWVVWTCLTCWQDYTVLTTRAVENGIVASFIGL
ncbi:hypothetical protein Btru_036513 [Bulinus truncatus]|nr:hypothetical protein Btru_036513 [Bulinus truncatus]